MKVVIVADHHYFEDEDGIVYVPSVYDYSYWKRYLDVFEEITVVCRGNRQISFDKSKMIVASGPRVRFSFIYDFSGIKDLALHWFAVKRQMRCHLSDCDCAIIRVPSPLSQFAIKEVLRSSKVFACEVAADPAENYNTVPFSRLVKAVMYNHCREACLKANGISYVTKESLQQRYPSHARLFGETNERFESYSSNANLSACFFENRKSYAALADKPFRLLHVANVIDGEAKGHYVCLRILSELKDRGIDATITFVGDGPEIPWLQKTATEYGCIDRVTFVGRLACTEDLISAYLASDLVLLPSMTEGLPRCLIEAMACGVVCLASNVGGIPELLPEDCLFDWQDYVGFADKIARLCVDRTALEVLGAQNALTAQQYSAEKLQMKRNEFYGKLRACCEVKI